MLLNIVLLLIQNIKRSLLSVPLLLNNSYTNSSENASETYCIQIESKSWRTDELATFLPARSGLWYVDTTQFKVNY